MIISAQALLLLLIALPLGAHASQPESLTITHASGKTEGSIVVAGQEHEVGISVVAVIGSTGKCRV